MIKRYLWSLIAALALAAPLAVITQPPPARAVVATTKFLLNPTTWTDLGAGPLLVSFTGSAVYAVSDTTPSLAQEGFQIPPNTSLILGNTTSHVWGLSVGPGAANAFVAPINASGGGGGTLTAGSSATSGFTAGQLLMSDGSLLQASTAATSVNAKNALQFGGLPIYANSRGTVLNTLWLTADGGYGLSSAWATLGFNILSTNDGGIQVTPAGYIGFSPSGNFDTSRPDIAFMRNGVGIAGFHNDAPLTSATALRVYNTFTDASNGEWGALDWQTTPNVLTIGTQKNGTGSARAMNLVASGLQMNGTAAVSCTTGTVSAATMVVTNGIVTHC